MQLIWEATLPIFPPSVNHQTGSNGRQRFDSAEYKQFKRDFQTLVGNDLKFVQAYANEPLALHVWFHWSGWITKAGDIRKRRDASNRYKAIEDAVFNAAGLDDSLNVYGAFGKSLPEGEEDKYTVVKLYVIEE